MALHKNCEECKHANIMKSGIVKCSADGKPKGNVIQKMGCFNFEKK